jgi:hypothetical protein
MKRGKAYRMKYCFQLVYFLVLLAVSGCTPVANSSPYPNPAMMTLMPTELPEVIQLMLTPQAKMTSTHSYPTPDPNDIPPELLFTPTPDPNAFTISAEIDRNYAQEEIAQILFSKWLDHFKGENISLEMRLDEYVINTIDIPFDQKCAKGSVQAFVAQTNITLETTLPVILSTTSGDSEWVSGNGNIEDANHITKLFNGLISKSGNAYILEVIMQIPMCD